MAPVTQNADQEVINEEMVDNILSQINLTPVELDQLVNEIDFALDEFQDKDSTQLGTDKPANELKHESGAISQDVTCDSNRATCSTPLSLNTTLTALDYYDVHSELTAIEDQAWSNQKPTPVAVLPPSPATVAVTTEMNNIPKPDRGSTDVDLNTSIASSSSLSLSIRSDISESTAAELAVLDKVLENYKQDPEFLTPSYIGNIDAEIPEQPEGKMETKAQTSSQKTKSKLKLHLAERQLQKEKEHTEREKENAAKEESRKIRSKLKCCITDRTAPNFNHNNTNMHEISGEETDGSTKHLKERRVAIPRTVPEADTASYSFNHFKLAPQRQSEVHQLHEATNYQNNQTEYVTGPVYHDNSTTQPTPPISNMHSPQAPTLVTTLAAPTAQLQLHQVLWLIPKNK